MRDVSLHANLAAVAARAMSAAGPGIVRQRADRTRWFTIPVVIVLAALPLLIFSQVPGHLLAGTMLAYLNTVIVGAACIYFVSMRSLEGIIPLLFVSFIGLAWPVSSIYLACFAPNSYYDTIWEEQRGHLDGMIRLQLSALVFLICYLTTIIAMIRSPGGTVTRVEPHHASARRMALITLIIAIFVIGLHLTSKVTSLGAADYVANGLFNYLSGLTFVVGALFLRLPVGTRALAILIMGGALVVYSIANARGQALMPTALFLIGLLFFAGLRPRSRTWLMLAIAVGIPFYMVIANTTRAISGRAGGFENFARRLELMGRWQEVVSGQPVLYGAMTRFFQVGGHSIVTLTPERYSYLPFSTIDYGLEFLKKTFVPGIIVGKPNYFYSTTYQLRRYDLRISEKTSIELSYIGSLWLIGGWVPLVIGSIGLGAFHGLAARWFRRTRMISPCKALFVFALAGQAFLWGYNLDPISHFRHVIWSIVIGLVIYTMFIRGFVREAAGTVVVESARGPRRTAPAA